MYPLSGYEGLVLYDAECGLCCAVVRSLLRFDRRGRLAYASLQGPVGQEILREEGLNTDDFDSMVFVPAGRAPRSGPLPLRTDAVFGVVGLLGAPWAWLRCFRVLPRRWRDGAYAFVARTRKKWVGDARPRPLEKPEWSRRFLDGSMK